MRDSVFMRVVSVLCLMAFLPTSVGAQMLAPSSGPTAAQPGAGVPGFAEKLADLQARPDVQRAVGALNAAATTSSVPDASRLAKAQEALAKVNWFGKKKATTPRPESA